MKTLKFKVEKMKCNGCVNLIKTGLSEVDGIENVDTDLFSKMVTVTVNDADDNKISAKLQSIGYEGIRME